MTVFTTLASNKTNNNAPKAGNKSALGFFIKILTGLAVALFWLIIWYALALYVDKEILLPKPEVVFLRLRDLGIEPEFWLSCSTTVLRIVIGTVLGCIFGIILAFAMLISEVVCKIFAPVIYAVKATPVASFIIAALYWLNRGEVPAFISFLIVLPVICDAVYSGIKNTDRKLLEVAKVYRFSLRRKISYLYIPSAVPYFLSALKTSIGMAWKSGVAAEVLCTPANSIGRELYQSKVLLETPDTFAWTLVIIILSVIFEKITVWLIGRGLKKYGIMKENDDAENK